GALSLSSDATYNFELNSSAAQADKIVANGVSLDSAALFSFADLGNKLLLADGTLVLVLIDNTATTDITGRFANLAEGDFIYANNNAYMASYRGGTGNDLTLTVVPEPGVAAFLLAAAVPLLGCRRRWKKRASPA